MGAEPQAAEGIAARRAILDWRDRHELAIPIALARAWRDARPLVEEKIDEIGWQELLTNPDAFIAREVDPLVAQLVAPAAQRLLAEAQADLGQVLEAELALHGIPLLDDGGDAAFDLVAGLGPLAAGVGIAAALPTAAVVGGTAFFGLVATSAVSAPILLGSLALAGAGVATGVVNTRDIRSKRIARMREKVDTHVADTILSLDRPDALAARLVAALHKAAEAMTGDA